MSIVVSVVRWPHKKYCTQSSKLSYTAQKYRTNRYRGLFFAGQDHKLFSFRADRGGGAIKDFQRLWPHISSSCRTSDRWWVSHNFDLFQINFFIKDPNIQWFSYFLDALKINVSKNTFLTC